MRKWLKGYLTVVLLFIVLVVVVSSISFGFDYLLSQLL